MGTNLDTNFMEWHVQYRDDAMDLVSRYHTPELAIKAACDLIDGGWDVHAIGTGPLTNSIEKDEIIRIHALLAPARRMAGQP